MDSMPVVLDISSGEESGGETAGGYDDYDWISELLHETMGEGEDDADGLVLEGAFALHPNLRSNGDAKLLVKDLDDDCVVLDGDPDKPMVVENSATVDSDDLLIVAEKGQIACRDYPHPRHLCAEFPFTSTPHESYCHQCHCYVCDSLAPCVNWGNGTSSINHCHATDKDEFWKLLRQSWKQGDKAPLAGSKLPNSSLSMQTLQASQCPPFRQKQPISLVQNQISRPTTIRACSRSTNFGLTNIANQGASQQSVHFPSRNKFSPHLVSQHLLNTRNNTIQRDTRQNSRSLGPPVINYRTVFKRAGSAGVALATNRAGYRSSNNNYAYQCSRSPSRVAASPTSWQPFPSRMNSCSNDNMPSQQITGSSFRNSVPSQPQVSSHPGMGGVVNSVPSQPGVSSPPNMASSFVNSVPSPQASSQTNQGCNFENSVPSQPQVSFQPNMGSRFLNPVPSETQVYSQPIDTASDRHDGFQQGNRTRSDLDASFSYPVSSETQVYSQPIDTASDRHDGFQQGNVTQNALDTSFSDSNAGWFSPSGHCNQQPFADNYQVRSAALLNYNPPPLPDFDPQIPINTNRGSLDFQFDSWMLENQSVLGALEVSEPSELNLFSPESAPADASFLFGF